MRLSTDSKIFAGLMVGLVLLVVVGILSLMALREFEDAAAVRSRTYEVNAALSELLFQIKDAESSQRGYLLTEDETYVRPFNRQSVQAPATLARLRALSLDPNVQNRLEEMEPLLTQKLAEMQETLELNRVEGREAALQMVNTDQGFQLMQEIRALAEKISAQQDNLLEQRTQKTETQRTLVLTTILAAVALAVLLKGIALWIIRQDMRSRKKAEIALGEANALLEDRIAELNGRTTEASTLRNMVNVLQACTSREEGAQAIGQYGPQLFRGSNGAVFTYNSSRDLAEQVAGWGHNGDTQKAFSPNECWALRLGHDYHIDDDHRGLRCGHVEDFVDTYICVPMLAQGDAVGMLHLDYPNDGLTAEQRETTSQLAGMVADQVASALVNLKLRETLEQRSIRDPLTGLFNRRYLEESLTRELRRAERRNASVAVAMADLDHFKRLNDTYGHEAGDAVLAAVGHLLLSSTRAEDFCCRYGGEELAVIMPEADIETALARIEELCKKIGDMVIQHNEVTLKVTASFGVATFPQHGKTVAQVMKSADLALYQAKKQGRNRVVSA